MQTQDIRKFVRVIAKRSGVPGRIWPHLFRHSLATAMLSRGASIYSIQALLGHTFISTTMEYYLHPSARTSEAITTAAFRPTSSPLPTVGGCRAGSAHPRTAQNEKSAYCSAAIPRKAVTWHVGKLPSGATPKSKRKLAPLALAAALVAANAAAVFTVQVES